MLLQVFLGFCIILYVSFTHFNEDLAILSDYNHIQAVVIGLEENSSLKQFRGHCQCHWNYPQGQTSNSKANDKVFHAQFSREAIAQSCARIEQDRFRRDLALNSGSTRWLACGRKFRLFHRNSKNGFSPIFDRVKHSSLPRLCVRTRADHYNVQLVAVDGFNPGTREKLSKISVWAIKSQKLKILLFEHFLLDFSVIFQLNIMSAKDITKSAASGVEPLATASAAECEKYEKDKNKSRAIVLQCLVPRLQPAAMKHDTTEAVWTHLKKIFEPSLIAREASLVEEFYSMRRHENEETAVPNKPGWEREEVQRQSGATKGQWDIYFYAPGRRFPLRSRPEIQDYCEKTLNVPYNPDEFS
uniref:MBD domain-containing protein n=1 Tax=Strigamia maritima TaxID=126957 RepID=T1IL04_STRMM